MKNKPTFLHQQNPILCAISESGEPESVITDMCNAFSDGADAFSFEFDRMQMECRGYEEIRHICSFAGEKPVYITNYRQGYNQGRSDDELVDDLLVGLKAGATLIDVMGDLYDPQPLEITQSKDAILRQKSLISEIHTKGGEVIMSSHTKKFLPQDEVVAIAKQQESRGADIAKIVTWADTYDELLENLSASVRMKKELSIPFMFLSCGRCCKIQRITGYMFGSSIMLGVAGHVNDNSRIQPTVRSLRAVLSNTYWQEDRPE
mgnify:CR=1 FL=1|jgi:3-dehydroquinate dehydratase